MLAGELTLGRERQSESGSGAQTKQISQMSVRNCDMSVLQRCLRRMVSLRYFSIAEENWLFVLGHCISPCSFDNAEHIVFIPFSRQKLQYLFK